MARRPNSDVVDLVENLAGERVEVLRRRGRPSKGAAGLGRAGQTSCARDLDAVAGERRRGPAPARGIAGWRTGGPPSRLRTRSIAITAPTAVRWDWLAGSCTSTVAPRFAAAQVDPDEGWPTLARPLNQRAAPAREALGRKQSQHAQTSRRLASVAVVVASSKPIRVATVGAPMTVGSVSCSGVSIRKYAAARALGEAHLPGV